MASTRWILVSWMTPSLRHGRRFTEVTFLEVALFTSSAILFKITCHFFVSPAHHVPPLTFADLAATIKAITPSAAGFRSLYLVDLKLLSDLALRVLADLLNCVEGGAHWPQQMLHAKAALLPKDTSTPYEPHSL